tara:strand:+ start:1936 stop:2427 length:492 start_codon:yes stop_codon:yes gene_type:complete
MNEQSEQIKKNFLEQWIRLAFVALYIIAFSLLWPLIAAALLVLIILQSLHRVIASENNQTLLTVCDALGNFLFKILQYVLYLNDEKPIDFEAFFSKNGQEESSDHAEFKSEEKSKNDRKARSENVADTTDDVFADISFTEKADDDAEDDEDDEDDEEQQKKSD